MKKNLKMFVTCGVLFAVIPLMADTWTDPDTGYTWTYRINGDTAEIYNNYYAAISPKPTCAVTIPSTLGGKPVTSIGESAFRDCSELTSVTISSSVTSIGDCAFYGCNGLISVTISSSVTSIGDNVFGGCNGLMSIMVASDNSKYSSVNGLLLSKDGRTLIQGVNGDVTIPDNVTSIGAYAFYNYSGLTSVTIPDSVTSIGAEAFTACSEINSVLVIDLAAWCRISFADSDSNPLYYADNLFLNGSLVTDLVIPDSVTSIGERAFYNCSGLTSVTIPDSVADIGQVAFGGCSSLTNVTIGKGVTSIGESAFCDCSGLTGMTIPDGVTSIGEWAFSGCSGLSDESGFVIVGNTLYNYYGDGGDVLIPSCVTNIGYAAFLDCSGLTSVTIPDSVTSIGSYAFEGCSGLTSMTIPDGVTCIGYGAFSGCSGLTSVTIPTSVTSIGYEAFRDCSGLTSVTIPNSVTSIGVGAFFSCHGLTSVTIPDSVTSIGESAFKYCYDLTSVTIPNSVISIGDSAFNYCSGLTSVTIGNSVTSIGYAAFSGCTNLASANIPYSVMRIGGYAFENCDKLLDTNTIPGVLMLDGWVVGYDSNHGFETVDDEYGRRCVRLDFSGVAGIADYAFNHQIYECDVIDMKFGSSVRGIGCYALAAIVHYVWVDLTDTRHIGSIGEAAFSGCNVYAYSPQLNVENADDQAFSGCNHNLADGEGFVIVSGVLYEYQGHCNYNNITIPDGVTRIGPYAFASLSSAFDIRNITISDSVTSIGNYAFSDGGLEYLSIGNGVADIDDYAFYGFQGHIMVDDGNPYYKVEDGLMMTKDGTRLLYAAAIDECLTIPASVLSIDSGVLGCKGNLYNMTNLWFRGNAPEVESLSGLDANSCTIHVSRHSTGWGVAIPGKWKGIPIDYVPVYSVTFDLGEHGVRSGGGALEQMVEYGDDATEPEVAPNVGWVFAGWDCALSNVTESMSVSANYVRAPLSPAEASGLDGLWTDGGASGWTPEWSDDAHDGLNHLHSGAIGDNQESWIETVVTNTGVVSFWWKASSEEYRGIAYDKVVFSVDGVDITSIGGEVDWTNVTCAVEGIGPHVLRWTYRKDESDYGGQDCAWLDEVQYLREVRVAFADGGATDGSVPATEIVGEGLQITLPDQGSLIWPKHRFAGWRTGDEIIAPGTPYALGYDDVTFTAVWEEKRVLVPTIEVAAWYDTERTAVTMGCETAGATIHYTLDGSTPTAASSVYAGSFYLAGSATIKAIAVLDDFFDSDVASAESVRAPWTPDECLNAPVVVFNMGGDAIWVRDRTMTHDGDTAMRSGAIGDNQTSWVEASVSGAGTLTFWWKVSSEAYKGTIYDYARFTVDGIAAVSDIGGEIDWRNETVTITDGGTHTFRWAYVKDAQNTNGSDCAWLDEVTWVPVASPDPIPPVVSDDEVEVALAGTADGNLTANVTNVAQYAAYRTWALSVTNATTTVQTIKESTRTWLSYAFAADVLINKELTSDDVKIESFTPASTDGKFEFTVSVKDVNIGGGSVEVETLKENLKKVLGIEGSVTLSPDGFSSDNIDITFDTPVDGKARFIVSPPADAGNSFFMRVKVK